MKRDRFNDRLTPAALKVCSKISRHGEKVYVVGGTLRDIILGRDAVDVDLATTATPSRLIDIFKRVVPTGIKHGTVTILMDDEKFEVTTLRGETSYSDGRHPDEVTYIDDIREDLARRDFTINAIAWDPIDETLHDPFGGQGDLEKGLIRAVGNPLERFTEDGLRVLRAARFATTHRFEIEAGTAAAIPKAASTLGKVAAERKREELLRILKAEKPSVGFAVMKGGGLLPHISGELAGVGEPFWGQTLARLDGSPPQIHVRLAALYFGLPDDSKACAAWLKQMRFDRVTLRVVPHLITIAGDMIAGDEGFETWDGAQCRRFAMRAGKEHVLSAMALLRADVSAKKRPVAPLDGLLAKIQSVLKSGHPLGLGDLAISGSDLIEALPIPPGPRIGQILSALLDHVLDHPEDNTEDKLLSIAKNSTP